MGKTITSHTQMQCPHGGMIQGFSANPRVQIQGASALTPADTFIILGCAFAPGGVPSPCTSIAWLTTDQRASIQGNPTLSEHNVGLCLNPQQIPQGKVIIQSTQPKVATQ